MKAKVNKAINKLNISALLTFVAVFLAALLVGFFSEMKVAQTADRVTRIELMAEISRAIKILKPLMKLKEPEFRPGVNSENLPEKAILAIKRELVQSLPDGNWAMGGLVTRGEGVFYLKRLFTFIKENMILQPFVLKTRSEFKDIRADHWLAESLNNLEGIGALKCFEPGRFNPDSFLCVSELKQVIATIIDYFSKDKLIAIYDLKNIRFVFKGCLKKLQAKEWEFSYDEVNWEKLTPSGEIIPVFPNAEMIQVFLKHPGYKVVGPIEVIADVSSSDIYTLKKNYNELSKRVRSTFASLKQKRSKIRMRLAAARKLNGFTDVKLAKHSYRKKKQERQIPELPPVETIIDEPVVKKTMVSSIKSKPEWLEPKKKITRKKVAKSSNKPGFKTFKGIVVDAITGKNISGSMVIVENQTLTTNSHGEFSFEAKNHSILNVTAYSEGYIPLSLKHRAGYRAGALVLSLKPQLQYFAGKVLDFNTKAPIKKALIRIGKRAVRTSATGDFKIKGLKPGYYQLSCYADGFMEAHEIVYVDQKNTSDYSLEVRPIFAEDQWFELDQDTPAIEPEEVTSYQPPIKNIDLNRFAFSN